MDHKSKVDENILNSLACPYCLSALVISSDFLICSNKECAKPFPVVNGVPIIINEQKSIFEIKDFLDQNDTFFESDKPEGVLQKIKGFVKRLIPDLNLSVNADKNCQKLIELLLENNKNPKVLVIGGGVVGKGLESVIDHPQVTFVETDVDFGGRTRLICDAHDLPFADETFDAVIAQAVLEHVCDPYRCVSEFHRVLKKDGLVYAETPFMQQVHAGKFDFTRFTFLGHRRLFRWFETIENGPICGPAMAYSWSLEYFLISFVRKKGLLRFALKFLVRILLFWMKHLDIFLVRLPGAYEAAAAYFFMGKKSDVVLSDKELIQIGSKLYD